VATRCFIVYISLMPKPAQPRNTSLLVLMVAMIAVVAVTGVAIWRITQNDPEASASSGVNIGGPFTLTDQTGATVTDKTYDG